MLKSKSREEEMILRIYRISRLVRGRMSFHRDSHEASMLQVQALMAIPIEGLTMSQFADQLQIRLPTASFLIHRLSQTGYVKRIHDSKDRRVTHITLTPSGRRELGRTMKIKMKHIKLFLNLLSTQDKRSLDGIIKRLMQKIEHNEN